MPIRRRTLLTLAAAPLVVHAQDTEDTFTGFAGTRVRFAGVDRARAVLSADDDWMAATSEFQRQAVMQGAATVSLETFKRWNADAVLPWSAVERARWLKVLDTLAPAFAELRIPLPSEVLLIASNGQESARAPYTRANAVVMADGGRIPGHSETMLMAHELWHVASRHAPALATRLYRELGFEPMPELEFPAAWAPVRIANPDAPGNRHAIELDLGGRRAWVTPVLVAARTTLQPGETFFDVLQPRLLEVRIERGAAFTQAVLDERGQPVWHAIGPGNDYLRRLGGNTGYVIHPEEALADNIALLATGAPARNPQLLQRLKAVLQS